MGAGVLALTLGNNSLNPELSAQNHVVISPTGLAGILCPFNRVHREITQGY